MNPTFASRLRRLDVFCARLNDGLAAVAIVLALVTTAALIERLPQAQPGSDDLTFADPRIGPSP